MNVQLLSITDPSPGNLPTIEQFIEYCGRVCWRTDLAPDSTERFIRMLIKKAHVSVIEHAYASFKFTGISRSCSHQIVRHRLASYSQESMRYVDMDGQKVVEPWTIHANSVAIDQYRRAVIGAFRAYKAMRDLGIPKEDARYVLPIGTQTTIVMTCNFREWRHFIKMRTSKHAQWEIRGIANAVLDILHNQAPVIFEDLIE